MWMSQLVVGLQNGAFYAVLSLGLAVIFGLLNIVNFAHGALYMMGAYGAYIALNEFGLNYWVALFLSPLAIGAIGVLIERLLLRRLAGLDHLYGLLLTFGLALIIEGLFKQAYGVSGQSYPVPDALKGAYNLGFMRLPIYRGWVILAGVVVCLGVWVVIEKTKLGAYLRAGTENAKVAQALGINVPLAIMLTYGAGVALAAYAGVLAAPIFQANPEMGAKMVITVFAVVVIGGMGSIIGSIITGLGLGLIEGMTKVIWAPASDVVIFVIMAIVLLVRPAGLFGRSA